jgi:two-component sensor histidine kinase
LPFDPCDEKVAAKGSLMLKPTLSRRLFLLVLGAMVPLAAILFFNLYEIKSAKEREVHAEAFRLGQLAALEIQRIVDGLENTLSAVAVSPLITRQDRASCNDYISRISTQLPQFASLGVIDRNGVIWCRQTPGGLGTSLADRDYVKQVMSSGQFTVGEYTTGRIDGVPIIPIAVPVRDEKGQIEGAVIGTLNLEWLDKRISERSFAQNSNLTIADRQGVILARHPQPEKFVGTRIPDQYQRLVHAAEPATIELTSQDGTRRVLAYFPPAGLDRALYVSMGFSTEQEYAAINRATEFGVAVTGLAVIATLAAAWVTSKYAIEAPVKRLVATVEGWQADDNAVRTGMTPKDGEFGIVGHAIDHFMDQLAAAREQRQRDEQQRDLLIGELDHRVKNLLATVQSVARQTFKSNEANKPAIDVFNKRLQAMSDAYSLLMKGHLRAVVLSDLISQAIRPFESREEPQFATSGPDFDIESKAALSISMALHELCTNAVKYGALSGDMGKIAIIWEIDNSDSEPQFVLRWIERGGPPVTAPVGRGFGTNMIERALTNQLGGQVRMDYAVDGLRCTVIAPLRTVSAEPLPAGPESL